MKCCEESMSVQNEAFDEPVRLDDKDSEVHLAHYWAIVVKHSKLVTICLAAGLLMALVASLLSTPTYRASTVLNVEKDRSALFEIGATQQVIAGPDAEFLPTQTRLMKSREVAERVTKRLQKSAGTDPTHRESLSKLNSGGVQTNVEAVPVRGTSLVELSYVGTSPKLAADVVNAVADEYIQWTLEMKFEVVGQASRFLTSQISQLKGEIEKKEQQLQTYGRQNDIISADPQSNVTLQKLESLNQDYATAVAERVSKESRYREVETASADTLADTLSNGFVSQLRNDQARLERQYAEQLNLYKPDWPAMQQLKAQIEKGRQNLESVTQETVRRARDIARSEYLTAQRKEDSLKAVLQRQKSEAMALNSNAVEYNNLKVEVDTKRALMDKLLEQQAQTEVTSRLRGQGVSNVRVVDRALPPPIRFRPSYQRNALQGLLFGLALGLGLAFLLEYLDRSLRTPEQVEQYLGLPALAIIPAVGATARHRYGYFYGSRRKNAERDVSGEETRVELLPHQHPRTTGAEAYRAFRAALLLSRAGGLKSIVITSSLPAEGKTVTAINLAVVLGQLDKRVLLIDADLHKPRIHEVLRITNRAGLVSVLAENAKPGDVILKTSLPGVSAIPAGPLSPNPSGLLSSEAMSRFLEYARANFDYVVIDTPPISMVADAILLGYQADGAVVCVKGGSTPREQVARARDKLQRSNVRILGVLINNLEEDPTGYGKYYHYYTDQGTDAPAASRSGIA